MWNHRAATTATIHTMMAIIVGWVMLFTVILIPVAVIVWIVAVVAALWYHIRAAMAASRGESFRYPWGIPVLH